MSLVEARQELPLRRGAEETARVSIVITKITCFRQCAPASTIEISVRNKITNPKNQ
jgi:hypothetical protein